MTIERAGMAYSEVLAAIHARAFSKAETWDSRAIATHLAQPGVFGLVEPRGGFVLARVVADEAEILTLAVVPEARRLRIAASLLAEAMAHARACGARRMLLEVAFANEPARALYREAGFTEVGRRPGYYAGGGDALILAAMLSSAVPER